MVTDDIRERILVYVRELASQPPSQIAAEMAASQEQFLSQLEGISDDVAARRPAEGEWSLRELLRHVVLADEIVARTIAALAQGNAVVGGGIAERGTMLDDDGRSFAAYVAAARDAGAHLLDTIRDIGPSSSVTTMERHPLLGRLNCVEWAASQRVHAADHTQHAAKIIAAVGS